MSTDYDDDTLNDIFDAVWKDKLDLVKRALEGVNINASIRGGKTALYFAVCWGRTQIVKYLVSQGADVDKAKEFDGDTALIYALRMKRMDIVKCFISEGVDPNVLSPNGDTALIFCIKLGYFEGVKFLIDIGVNVYKPDGKDRKPPLWWAVKNQDETIVQCLVTNDAGFTADFCLIQAIDLRNLNIIKMLLNNGADANMGSRRSGRTPLIASIETRQVEIVEELLEKNADTNNKDSYGNIPLMKAIEVRNPDMVRSLIKRGSELNVVDQEGYTPLTKALQTENFEIVKFLVEQGANVNQVDGNNRNPLIIASNNCDCRNFQYLVDSGAELEQVAPQLEEVASQNEFFDFFLRKLKIVNKCKEKKNMLLEYTGHENE